jgi:membrane protein implicated in regulation of membrane protease activity
MSAPRLNVVPAWQSWAESIMFAIFVAVFTLLVISERERREGTEAALTEAQKQLATVNDALFACEAGHARISDRIERLGESW